MTDDGRAALDAEIRSYLPANPEVLVEMSRALRDKEAARQASDDRTSNARNAAALFSDGYSFVGCNPAGDMTLVEFPDYRCAYRRKAHAGVADLVRSDGKVRFIVREFSIFGEESVIAARFAIAALKATGPEAFAKINAGFYESFRGSVTAETLTAFAQGLGIDATPIPAAMNDADVTKVIEDTRQLAETLNIGGTQTFVLGGQMLRGYVPIDTLQAAPAEGRG